jgi:MFS family permease
VKLRRGTMLTAGQATGAFRSLSVPIYRRYFGAGVVSIVGTWMQSVALSWLVYDLTGSGSALGLAITLEFVPMTLLGPIAGVWVERHNKRKVLLWTQAVLMAQAALLGVLTATGAVELWMVYALALVYGTAFAVAGPAANVIVFEMVSPELLTNAVSLNLILFNVARIAGPALAGVAIAGIDIGPCFLLNAVSFIPVMVVLALIRDGDLHEIPIQTRAANQLRAAFKYVGRQRELIGPLVMLAIFGAFAWEFEVSIPLVAKRTFGGGPALFGLLTAAIGVGAVVGGVYAARQTNPKNRIQLVNAIIAGAALLAAGLAPVLWMEFVALAVAGGGITAWYGVLTARYQLSSSLDFQSRAMALWGTALNGARPIGAPIIGFIGESLGARATLLVGGGAIFLLCIPAWSVLTRHGVLATLRSGHEAMPVGLVRGADDVAGEVTQPADDVDRAPTGSVERS